MSKKHNKTNKYDQRFDTRTICIPLDVDDKEEEDGGGGERRRIREKRRIEFNSLSVTSKFFPY